MANEEESALLGRDEIIDGFVGINSSPKSSSKRLWQAVVTVCLGPISIGLALGYSSPAILELQSVGLLTTQQATWFGSLITVGAVAGGPISAFFVDKLGRKTCVILCNVPFVIGWFLIIYAHGPQGYLILYFGRIINGLGVGMVSLAAPLFIAEVSTVELRGTFGAGFQLSVALGVLFVYALGILLPYNWLAVACATVPVMLTVLTLFLPESPRWLISKGQRMPALDALKWYRGCDAEIEEEYLQIEANITNNSGEGLSCRDFINPGVCKPMLISIVLMIFQQVGGINAVIFYSETIFNQAGFPNISAAAVIVGAVQVAATFISCILMDRVGRRILLIVGGIFLTISSGTLGLYYYLYEQRHESLSWLALVSLIVFISAFSLGWGPIPWILMGEMFPVKSKAFSCGIATMVNWSSAFLVTKEFTDLETSLGKDGAFWLFGGMSLLSVLFVLFFVPETKGKTLEEIEEYFEPRTAYIEI